MAVNGCSALGLTLFVGLLGQGQLLEYRHPTGIKLVRQLSDDLNGESNGIHATKEGWNTLGNRFAEKSIQLVEASAAGATDGRRPRNPGLAQIKDQPGLPRVLLIGDSISIGYTLPTRERLRGIANVHRIPTNGTASDRGLVMLDRWLATGGTDKRWDVIHFVFERL